MLTEDGQPNGIEFSDYLENITILDFLNDASDNDSNASNGSFKFDKSYQKEFEREK